MGNILITGLAGFIGHHVAMKLIDKKTDIRGVDNLNEYYDSFLKGMRLQKLRNHAIKNSYSMGFLGIDLSSFCFYNGNDDAKYDLIIHLAAHSGVRTKPGAEIEYVHNNIDETAILFDWARRTGNKNILFASSSSVYGNVGDSGAICGETMPTEPKSMYAITKLTKEHMAKYYCENYGMNITALRFFTCYGPFGRPDMAVHLFTDAILKNETVKLFGYGKAKRDFIYIDDLVDAILLLSKHMDGFQVYNVGTEHSITNNQLADTIAHVCGKYPGYKSELLPLQQGEAKETRSLTYKIRELGWKNKIPLEQGIKRYVDWHREYYNF